MLKVSVIIPAYNAERYLPVTLDSAAAQTMDPSEFEVIVVNGSSTDGTEDVLKNFTSRCPNMSYVTQENLGPGEGRNTGMRLARGEYFFFLDADDILVPDALEKLYARAAERKADLVVAGYDIYDGYSHRKIEKILSLIRKDVISPYDTDLLWTFSLWNKLYRASVIRDHGLHFTDLIYSEDGVFLMSYLGCCKNITGLDDFILHYRKMSADLQDSITASVSKAKLQAYLKAHHMMRRILKERLLKKYPDCHGVTELCRRHPDAGAFLSEFAYKELYVLIDQFYLHYWNMNEEARKLTIDATLARFSKMSPRNLLRTRQQWYDLDVSLFGREAETVRDHANIAAVLYGGPEDEDDGESFLRTLRRLTVQDLVYLKILVPESTEVMVKKEGLMQGNIFFLPAESEEEFYLKASEESGARYIVRCMRDADYPPSALRIMYRRLTLAHAKRQASYPPAEDQYRGEQIGHVLDKIKREMQKVRLLSDKR